MTDALLKALTGQPKNSLRLVLVTIATTSPLTVTLPDGETVDAIGVTGLTYTTSGTGIAFLSEGATPVVLPTS